MVEEKTKRSKNRQTQKEHITSSHTHRFEICSCRGAISSFHASATLVALRWIRKALSLVEAWVVEYTHWLIRGSAVPKPAHPYIRPNSITGSTATSSYLLMQRRRKKKEGWQRVEELSETVNVGALLTRCTLTDNLPAQKLLTKIKQARSRKKKGTILHATPFHCIISHAYLMRR